ncbi:MAG: PH domain-containing protein [Candidatus Omnitrophica bacterium]|nr:hypothetical protein [bacterium]NUN97233.1 PH domain-containing protein [Candidatus Omnitrophota bacterium]
MAEEILWEGAPSQWTNFGVFFLCGVLIVGLGVASFATPPAALLILPVLIFGFWKWLVLRCEWYTLTSERIRRSEGVLSKTQAELELYRVKDMAVNRPFLLRIVGLGNLVLMTSDKTDPEFLIPAVPNPDDLLDQVRKNVEIRRDQKRVREIDME